MSNRQWTTVLASCISFLGLGSPLCGQRTWIVDYLNRPGTDFVNFPAAIAAAADGDHIRLRTYAANFSQYSAADITKAVTITGDGVPPVYLGTAPPQYSVTISKVPAGKTVRIANVIIGGALNIDTCAGLVCLDSIGKTSYGSDQTRVLAKNCAGVTISNSDLNGMGLAAESPLYSIMSNVALSNCTLIGAASWSSIIPGNPAIQCNGGTLSLSQCDAYGGTYMSGFPPIIWPALISQDTTLMVAGSSNRAALKAGIGWPGVRAVVTTGGTVIMDPNVPLRDSSSMPDTVSGTAQVFIQRIPAVSTGKASLGGNLSVNIISEAGVPYGAVIALPTLPSSSSWGPLWVEANTMGILDIGIMGPLETKAIQVPLPSLPALLTLPLVVQAIAGNSALSISGPSVSVVR